MKLKTRGAPRPFLPSVVFCSSVSSLILPTLLSAGTLSWDAADTANASADGGTGAWDTSSPNWWNGASNAVWTNGDDAVFGGSAGTVTIAETGLSAASLTFDTAGYTLNTGGFHVTAGILAGTNGFTKSGAGNLTLTGNSSGYTGATVITGGMVRLNSGASLSNGSGITLNGGGAMTGVVDGFDYNLYPFKNITRHGTLNLLGTGDQLGAQTVTMNNGTVLWRASGNGTSATIQNIALASGHNTLAVGPQGGNNTLNITNLDRTSSSATVEFRSAYSPLGTGEPRISLTNVGGSAVTNSNGILGGWAVVAAPSTNAEYAGGAQGFAAWNGSNSVILAGFDAQTSTTALITGASTQNWLVNGNGGAANSTITANTTVNSAVVQSDLIINGGSTLTLGSGGLILRNSNFWIQSTSGGGFLTSGEATGKLFVHGDGGAGDQAIRVIIKDNDTTPVTLVKSGTGKLNLSQTNTYSGGTIINQGTLDLIGGGGQSGTIRGSVTVREAATLQLSTGDATGWGGGANALTEINLEGGRLHVNTSFNQTLGGTVVNMRGASITGIANSNLDFFGGAAALDSLASSITSTISGVALDIRQNTGLTLNVAKGTTASGIDLDISSLITNRAPSGGIPGTGTNYGANPLIKTGAGTLRLTGSNNYTGNTAVNEGTLIVDNTTGSGTGFGNVNVSTGAALGGSGIIGGFTTISGHHTPGNSPGLQTFENGLAYTATATLVWELIANTDSGRGSNFDGVNVTGGVFSIAPGAIIDLSFGDAVNFLDAFWQTNREWLVIDLASGELAEDSNLFTIGAITGGSNHSGSLGEFTVTRNDGDVYLSWTAIPEPTSAMLGGLGLLGLLRRRRV